MAIEAEDKGRKEEKGNKIKKKVTKEERRKELMQERNIIHSTISNRQYPADTIQRDHYNQDMVQQEKEEIKEGPNPNKELTISD
eukprot:14893088-Ditylum_brightwellii.AAC.1